EIRMRESEFQKKRERLQDQEDSLDAKIRTAEEQFVFRQKEQETFFEKRKEAFERKLDERKRLVEKGLNEKSSQISVNEEQTSALRDEVESFPFKIEQAIIKVENDLTEKLSLKHHHDMDVMRHEHEKEMSLNKEMITHLEDALLDKNKETQALKQKMASVEQKAHQILAKTVNRKINLNQTIGRSDKKIVSEVGFVPRIVRSSKL
ncbi:MAG: hypothetical protein ACI9BD_001531, partial [Candidatus Marinamargulisbacteria bacterium]